MSNIVDIRWPIALPGRIPLQHEYHLLAALSRLVPSIHAASGLGIHSIRGAAIEPRMLELTRHSALAIRCNIDLLPCLLLLSGKKLDLGGCFIRLGVPHLITLHPSSNLVSNFVTIKGFMDGDSFSAAIRRQLDSLGVRRSISVVVDKRQVRRIKQKMIVGFQVMLGDLNEAESLQVQAAGVGGRRHLGAGIFSAITQAEHNERANERYKESQVS